MTNDDPLIEMLKIISLGPDPERRMGNNIELFAPWMSGTDAEQLICRIMRMSAYERWPKPKILGESLRLTNAERERFGLWAIAPCDISDDDLAEQRKAKDRERKRRRRAEQGRMTRQAYLAQFCANPKPWKAAAVSRATWFRRKAIESRVTPAATGQISPRGGYGAAAWQTANSPQQGHQRRSQWLGGVAGWH